MDILPGTPVEGDVAAAQLIPPGHKILTRAVKRGEPIRKYNQIIDTHTADGVKVGLQHREAGVPLICLETALPAKFAATIKEAIGRDPEVPYGMTGLERLPQRFCVLDADDVAVKDLIVRTCANP